MTPILLCLGKVQSYALWQNGIPRKWAWGGTPVAGNSHDLSETSREREEGKGKFSLSVYLDGCSSSDWMET